MASQLKPAQIRGARAMLGWSMSDLAEAAGVSVSTVKRMQTQYARSPSLDIHSMIRDAFAQAGVRFLDDEGEGAGVRLAHPAAP